MLKIANVNQFLLKNNKYLPVPFERTYGTKHLKSVTGILRVSGLRG